MECKTKQIVSKRYACGNSESLVAAMRNHIHAYFKPTKRSDSRMNEPSQKFSSGAMYTDDFKQ
eukprot:4416243-Karenia_brevis.AAC.1